MERLSQLTHVFQDVFEDDSLRIDRDTTAADIDGWDSLMHVTLVLDVEKAFGIRFTSSEVAGFKNVGDVLDAIERHLSLR